jgi:hypothetical protein
MAAQPTAAQLASIGFVKASEGVSSDGVIDQAIHQGVIGSNMAAHYKIAWQADPKGTHDYLVSLGLIKDEDWNDNPTPAPTPTPTRSRSRLRHPTSTTLPG